MISTRDRQVFLTAVAALALVAWLPAAVAAQDEHSAQEATDATRQSNCRLAIQALTTGRPEPKYDWAKDFLSLCEVSAGSTLAVLWQRPTSDSASLSELYVMSARVRDKRVLDAVMAVADDPTAGWWRRSTALRVMAIYVAPGVRFKPDDIRIRSDSALRHTVVTHTVQREGSEPFDATWLVRVRDLFQRLSSTDADPILRHSARVIGDVLKPALPD